MFLLTILATSGCQIQLLQVTVMDNPPLFLVDKELYPLAVGKCCLHGCRQGWLAHFHLSIVKGCRQQLQPRAVGKELAPVAAGIFGFL